MSKKLAIEGGEPVRKDLLPYATQWVNHKEISEMVDTLKSDWLTTGPKVKQFENNFAKYVCAKYAVAVNSGTAALHCANLACGTKYGDHVVTSPFTFIATINSIFQANGKPILADIKKDTFNIDINSVLSLNLNNSEFYSIISVDFAGQPCDMNELKELTDNYGLYLISDSCHSLGAKYKGKKVGSIADMSCFSFTPVKNMTTAEGGMITTNDEVLYNKLCQIRDHGLNRSYGTYQYDMERLGYNYRMNELQASLGIHQLNKLISMFQNERKKIVNIYNKELPSIPHITIPYVKNDIEHAWHLYCILLDIDNLNCGRLDIYRALLAEGIKTQVHFIPAYQHSYYVKRFANQEFPNTEWVYERILTIPLFPKMKEDDVYDVINALEKVINYYKK